MGVYIGTIYQEVEYIESSGTQYIDTGKTVSGDVKIDYTYMPKETVSSSASGGILVTIDNDWRNNGFGSGNTYTYYGGNTSNNEGYTVGTLQQNVLCHDIIAKSGCSRTLNGTTVSYVPSSSYPSPTGTLKLFVSQRAGSITNYWKTRMYSFKRYDSGVLTQDLVPCYRKSDNVIGVFDKVENKFYTNAGSGTFTKGNDVRVLQPELKNAYIGGYYEYSYDFRNKTTSLMEADGWTFILNKSSAVFNSNGLNGSSIDVSVMAKIENLSTIMPNAKRVTLSMNGNLTNKISTRLSLYNVATSSTRSGVTGPRASNSESKIQTSIYGTNTTSSATVSGVITVTTILDLENGTWTTTSSAGYSNNGTLSSSDINNIKNNSIGFYVSSGWTTGGSNAGGLSSINLQIDY